MAIKLIAAVDDMGGLSAHGRTPWDEPADRAHFRKLVAGAPLLMGHGTYQAIGRTMQRGAIVATHHPSLHLPDCTVITDVAGYLRQVQRTGKMLWVIGGAEVYAAALPFSSEVHLTRIPGSYNCDRFFPSLAGYKGSVITYQLAELL